MKRYTIGSDRQSTGRKIEAEGSRRSVSGVAYSPRNRSWTAAPFFSPSWPGDNSPGPCRLPHSSPSSVPRACLSDQQPQPQGKNLITHYSYRTLGKPLETTRGKRAEGSRVYYWSNDLSQDEYKGAPTGSALERTTPSRPMGAQHTARAWSLHNNWNAWRLDACCQRVQRQNKPD